MGYTELLPPLPEAAVIEADPVALHFGVRPDKARIDRYFDVNQLRTYALAAIEAAAPAIRKAERERCARLVKHRWRGGYAGEVVEDLAAAIRALPDQPLSGAAIRKDAP